MDLRDSATEAAFRGGLRDWLHHRLDGAEPDAWTADGLREWSKQLYSAGYAGLTWPAAYGGRGLAPTFQGIYAEESALAGAPDHVNVIGLGMVGPTLIAFGSSEQQAYFLPGILSGDVIFCQGFSEPEAGSDLAAVRTRAVSTGTGHYVLTGEKLWSSYAHLADYCLLLARTSDAGNKGLTCFLLDMRQPGVDVRPLRQITGDSDFSQLVLTDVRVPADAVLGRVGDGWRVAMTTLSHERGTFGITLTARLTVAFQRLLDTVRETGHETDPLVRAEVADLYVAIQGLRHTGYRALSTLVETGQPGPESSVLKLHWSHTHQRLTALGNRLLGPYAAVDGPWTRHLLRSRANTIEGGTSEILRGLIAERVLGLPRSR